MSKRDIKIAVWIFVGISLLFFGPVLLTKLTLDPTPPTRTPEQVAMLAKYRAENPPTYAEQFCDRVKGHVLGRHPQAKITCSYTDTSVRIEAGYKQDVYTAILIAQAVKAEAQHFLHVPISICYDGRCETLH